MAGPLGKRLERVAEDYPGTESAALATKAKALHEECELMTENYSADLARLLCFEHPLAAVEGRVA